MQFFLLLGNQGAFAAFTGKGALPIQKFYEQLEISLSIENHMGELQARFNIASVYFRGEKNSEAIDELSRCVDICNTHHWAIELVLCYIGISRLFRKIGSPDSREFAEGAHFIANKLGDLKLIGFTKQNLQQETKKQ